MRSSYLLLHARPLRTVYVHVVLLSDVVKPISCNPYFMSAGHTLAFCLYVGVTLTPSHCSPREPIDPLQLRAAFSVVCVLLSVVYYP
jgi:hypothetical protein